MAGGATGTQGAAAASHGADDLVIPFRTELSAISGRLVRLAATVDETLTRHRYPEPVSRILGEAMALAALLGSQLKFDGRLIVQTQSDGPIGFLVVNYETAGNMRGYASFDAERLAALDLKHAHPGQLLGRGHLAMTIDQGRDMERYQGIVEMNGGSLSDAAHEYFRASEQLPTFIRLSVARHFTGGGWHWRAGGLMVQHVTPEGGRQAPPPVDDKGNEGLPGEEDDNWQRVQMLAATVEDHELIDPSLSAERLLYRLFHEEGVRAAPGKPLRMACRCSRETVGVFLQRFGSAELADMKDADGSVTVTCEFCATPYHFTEADLSGPPTP